MKHKSKRKQIRKGLKQLAIYILIFAAGILTMCIVHGIAAN